MVWRGTGHENVGVARLDSAGGDDRAASAAPQLAWPGADIRGLTVFLRMHPAHQRRRDGPLSPRSGGHARNGTAGPTGTHWRRSRSCDPATHRGPPNHPHLRWRAKSPFGLLWRLLPDVRRALKNGCFKKDQLSRSSWTVDLIRTICFVDR